jgi:hypothetical protein
MKRLTMNRLMLVAHLLFVFVLSMAQNVRAEQMSSYEDGDAVFSTTPQAPMPDALDSLRLPEPGWMRGSGEMTPRERLTPELLKYFKLLIVVNKAAFGTTAQHMRIYDVSSGAPSTLLYDFMVSTGREDKGQMTPTPVGIYTLDPERFVPWPSANSNPDMKWAMYWDYEYTSRKSGFALHAAPPGTERRLGSRASHGCVRMNYDDVKYLFASIKRQYGGPVPRFAFDYSAGRTSREGVLAMSSAGQPVLRNGYQVLLAIVEEYD